MASSADKVMGGDYGTWCYKSPAYPEPNNNKTNLIYLGGNAIWRKVYYNNNYNRLEKLGAYYKYLNNYENNFTWRILF